MNSNLTQTLEQRRAQHAWEAIERVCADMRSAEQKEYAGEAKKLPVRIMTSGLGQALAFIASKSKEKKKGLGALLEDVSNWVLAERRLGRGINLKDKSLLRAVCYGDSLFLRRASDEVLRYLEWLNRFAEAKGLRDGE